MWRAEPTKLINEMSKSLKDMEPEEVMTFLQDFGLNGARALPVFMAMAKDARNAGAGFSVLETNLNAANDSTGELDRQFGITMETLAAAWQTFLNSLQGAGFDAMADWGPILTDVLNGAGDLLDWAREFVGTGIGKVIATGAIGLGALATALAGAAAGAAILGASMLAIKSAAASGVFGAKAATTIGQFGNNAKLAGDGMVVLGSNADSAAPKLSTLGVNATKADKAMAGLKRAGAGVAGVLGGPIGIALTAATAIGILGASAVQTSRSYRDLGAAITEVNAQTGKSMGSDDILMAAASNFINNDVLSQLAYGMQSAVTGNDITEIDTRDMVEYIRLVQEGNKLRAQGKSTGTGFGWKETDGTGYANMKFDNGSGRGEVVGRASEEIGTALSKMSSTDASIAFNQLWEDAEKAGVSIDGLVDSLGDDFSSAFYSSSTSTERGKQLLAEYGATAESSKAAITEMNPALEEMEAAIEGVFAGLNEGNQAMAGTFGAIAGGQQAFDGMTQALVDLGVANAETGELIKGDLDIYDELTGNWYIVAIDGSRVAWPVRHGGYGYQPVKP